MAANVLMDASRDLRMSLPRTETHLFADIPGLDDDDGHRWGGSDGGDRGVPERTLFAHRERAERLLTTTYAATH